MIRGRKPKPTALKRRDGNPGKRCYNHGEPQPPTTLPDCPPHLSDIAMDEWDRLAEVLHGIGLMTLVDRAALAAYCQAYSRWVEAEERLKDTPVLLKTPSGYVQQSPWLSISNKQLELMGRYMTELGMTPASRSRVAINDDPTHEPVDRIEIVVVSTDQDGNRTERPLHEPRADPRPHVETASGKRIEISEDL